MKPRDYLELINTVIYLLQELAIPMRAFSDKKPPTQGSTSDSRITGSCGERAEYPATCGERQTINYMPSEIPVFCSEGVKKQSRRRNIVLLTIVIIAKCLHYVNTKNICVAMGCKSHESHAPFINLRQKKTSRKSSLSGTI